ncbi:MAG: hypothetical protein IT446_02850 [Phycisphaerales bacterium]|nr:hypothetical protein [Phycisphaerales bacterium]
MKKQNLLIAFFALTALALLAANWFATTPAIAAVSVKDRDYQVVTARVQAGGDGVYILDNRTGMLGVFTYDPASRRLTGRAAQPIMNAFRTR